MKRNVLFAAFAAFALVVAAGEPIEEAARVATEKCRDIDTSSLDECASTTGRSPQHSAARKAIVKLYQARSQFMSACDGPKSLRRCQEEADWLLLSGMSAAAPKP